MDGSRSGEGGGGKAEGGQKEAGLIFKVSSLMSHLYPQDCKRLNKIIMKICSVGGDMGRGSPSRSLRWLTGRPLPESSSQMEIKHLASTHSLGPSNSASQNASQRNLETRTKVDVSTGTWGQKSPSPLHPQRRGWSCALQYASPDQCAKPAPRSF